MLKRLFAYILRETHCLKNMFKGCRGIDEIEGTLLMRKFTYIGCSCGKSFHGETPQTVIDLGWIKNKVV